MINRFITKLIEENIKHFPVILLTGPRQIRKSTTLYHDFLDKGYSYVTLDDKLELAIARVIQEVF